MAKKGAGFVLSFGLIKLKSLIRLPIGIIILLGLSMVHFLVFFVLPVSASPQSYYADIEIFADEAGFVTITGTTNHPTLIVDNSDMFTSKQKSIWKLNISTEEIFSNLVFKLHLPKNSVVNYLRTPSLARIEDSTGGLVIIGTAENQKLNLIAQYSTRKNAEVQWVEGRLFYWLIFIFAGIAGALLLFFIAANKLKFNKQKNHDLSFLTERQKIIYNIVKQSKKPLTQTAIQLKAGLPKSSVSRNIDSLVKRNLLIKNPSGMSNMITLNKELNTKENKKIPTPDF